MYKEMKQTMPVHTRKGKGKKEIDCIHSATY